MHATLPTPSLWPTAHRDLTHPDRPGAVLVHWDHGVLHVRVTDADARRHVESTAAALGVAFDWA